MALRNAMNVVQKGVEICASDRPIRAFGVIVEGQATFVSATDCWSEIDEDSGERYPTATLDVVDDIEARASNGTLDSIYTYWNGKTELETLPVAVKNPDDATIHHLSDCAKKSDDYIEIFFKTEEIKAIWIKEWADEGTKTAAKILAKYRKLPLIVVNGRDRIDDIADSIGANVTPGNDGFKSPTMETLFNV
jgi:hypothetical protein